MSLGNAGQREFPMLFVTNIILARVNNANCLKPDKVVAALYDGKNNNKDAGQSRTKYTVRCYSHYKINVLHAGHSPSRTKHSVRGLFLNDIKYIKAGQNPPLKGDKNLAGVARGFLPFPLFRANRRKPTYETHPVPTPYDISGSSAWRNKADNCITIYRHIESNLVDIHVQKIRLKENGQIGMVTLKYDAVTGKYYEQGGAIGHSRDRSTQRKVTASLTALKQG
jgi:hypothetical protein